MGLTVVAVLCDVAVADHHVVLQLVGPRCFQIETADLFAFVDRDMVQLQHFSAVVSAFYPAAWFRVLLLVAGDGGGVGGRGFFGFGRQWPDTTKGVLRRLCH